MVCRSKESKGNGVVSLVIVSHSAKLAEGVAELAREMAGPDVRLGAGSAVLSAEMALEQLPAERRAHVFLSEAPLVEGALAAAVEARLDSPVAKVLAMARGALAMKGIGPQTETAAEAGQAGER